MVAASGSTTCQVSRCFHSWETTPTRLRTSSASLFQSPRGRPAELVDQDRRATLGQEQQGQARPDDLVLAASGPEPRELVLGADQLFGTQAIPVVPAEETQAGQPPGPLEPIKVVDLPLLAMPEILANVKVARQPVDATIQEGIECSLAAVMDRLALK